MMNRKSQSNLTSSQSTQPGNPLQSLLDHVSLAVFAVDRDGRYVAFNQAHAKKMKKIYGVDIQLGNSLLDGLTDVETRKKVQQNVNRALAGEQWVDVSSYGSNTENQSYYKIHVSPQLGADGAVVGADFSYEDVTELKQTETALKNSQDMFQSAFMFASVGVALIAATGEFLMVNPAFCKMLGYTEPELMGRTFSEITRGEDQSTGLKFLKDATTGLADSAQYEKRYVRKDGSWFWAEVSITTVRNAAGEFLYLIAHVQDISQSIKNQQELLEYQSRLAEVVEQQSHQLDRDKALYRSLFDNISSPIVVFSPQTGDMLDANPAACALFEKSYDDLLHLNMINMVQASPTELHRHAEKIRAGEKLQIEAVYTLPDGRVLNLGFYPGLIQFRQGSAVLAVIHDISEAKRAEQVLKDSESGLRKIIDAIPGLIFSALPDGQVDFFNQGWLSFTGLTLDQAQGTGWMQAVHPYDLPLMRQKWTEAVQSGAFFENEHRLRRFDGEYIWFLARAQPERDAEGRISKWYGADINIAKRKEAERALQENEELFHASFENANAGVTLFDSSGKFLRVNQKFCDMLGYTFEEMVNFTFNDITYPEDKEIGSGALKKLVNDEVKSTSIEKRYQHKDGHFIWVIVSTAKAHKQEGKRQYFVAYVQDISQRKKMEDKLRQLARAVEASPASIVITNTAGSIEYVNPKFTAVTGYTFEEAIGKNPRILKTGKTSPEEYHNMWQTILSGKEWRGEFYNRKKDGDFYYESVSISPIIDENGQISHFIAVKEDITGLKREQQRVLDALTFNQTILDSSPIGIEIYNASGQCISANQAACDILGTDLNTLLHENFHTFESWKTCELYPAALQALQFNQPVAVRPHYISTWGKELWLDSTFVSFKMGGEKHLLYMLQDDSSRQKAEIHLQLANQKLENLVADLERNKIEADWLRQMNDMLQVCSNVQEAYAVIEQFALQIYPDAQGALFMLIQNIRVMEVVSSWGADLASEKVFPVENCWSLRRGQVYRVHAAGGGLKCQHVDRDFAGSYLDIPLTATGEIMGLLHLEWPQVEDLDLKNSELINNFANIVSLSLSNIKLRETLHNQSVRDPLTRAFNRRYMEETLSRELPRAKRKNNHIGLIMLDIDFFKKVNDTYGHAAGDLVLTNLSSLVQSLVRVEDIVCRLGGEEFLVIMPDSDLNVSLQRAETIRQAVQNMQIDYSQQALITVTISAGVSVFPEHGLTGQDLLEKADAALYRAKGGGRNRVEAAD